MGGIFFPPGSGGGGGPGTVTSVSVTSANGFSGTVANPTTAPAITISTTITGIPVGNGTSFSASNVTNDTQTKAAIVPNTAPSSGQILVGNAGGTAYAPQSISGSGATISLASTGVMTISAIANASLSNSSITIAGNATALGGSVTQDNITGLSSTGIIKRTGANTLAIATADTDYTTPTGTETLTNKRITKRVVTAADATSITPNTDNADITYQSNSQVAGTLTINADTGTPTNGQAWLLKLKCTNAQTFSWNALYVGGTTALPTATTGGGKIDNYAFLYDTVNSKWQFTGQALGF